MSSKAFWIELFFRLFHYPETFHCCVCFFCSFLSLIADTRLTVVVIGLTCPIWTVPAQMMHHPLRHSSHCMRHITIITILQALIITCKRPIICRMGLKFRMHSMSNTDYLSRIHSRIWFTLGHQILPHRVYSCPHRILHQESAVMRQLTDITTIWTMRYNLTINIMEMDFCNVQKHFRMVAVACLLMSHMLYITKHINEGKMSFELWFEFVNTSLKISYW